MRRLEDTPGARVVGIGVGHLLGEVNGLHRSVTVEVRLGAGDECVGTGEFDQVGADVGRIDRIQLGGGSVVEPPRVVLPDGPHTPGNLAVSLSQLQMRREGDLTHQGADVLAGVHALDGRVMDVLHGVTQAGEFELNPVFAGDRCEVTGEKYLGLQRTDPFDGVDHGERVAIAVASHGDQIRDMAEQCAEHVAAQTDLRVGQPDHQRIGGLAARCGDEFESAFTDGESEGVLDDDVRGRGALSGKLAAEPFLDLGDAGSQSVGEGECAARRSIPNQALIVVTPLLPVGLRHDLRVGIAHAVQSPDVVIVSLRHDEVGHRRGVDGIKVGTMGQALKTHARVDDHAALRCRNHEDVGQSG